MDNKECPKCGVMNPSSRATCQACHTVLGGPINLNPLESKPPIHLPKKKPSSEKQTKESISVKKKTVAKRSKAAIEGTRVFLLDGNRLRTVVVSTSVRKSKPTSEEKRLISLWNRNKSLIK